MLRPTADDERVAEDEGARNAAAAVRSSPERFLGIPLRCAASGEEPGPPEPEEEAPVPAAACCLPPLPSLEGPWDAERCAARAIGEGGSAGAGASAASSLMLFTDGTRESPLGGEDEGAAAGALLLLLLERGAAWDDAVEERIG